MFPYSKKAALINKYRQNGIFSPIVELKTAQFSSAHALIELVTDALNDYDVLLMQPRSQTTSNTASSVFDEIDAMISTAPSDGFLYPFVSWNLYYSKAQNMGDNWQLVSMTGRVAVYQHADLYVIEVHRLSGDAHFFNELIAERISANITGEALPPHGFFSPFAQLPDDFSDTPQQQLDRLKITYDMAYSFTDSGPSPIQMSGIEVFTQMACPLAKLLSEKNNGVSAQAKEIALKTIACLLAFVNDSSPYHLEAAQNFQTNDEKATFSHLDTQFAQTTQAAVQCLYAFSQHPELFECLQATPQLERYLKALAAYQAPHSDHDHIHAQMKRTIKGILNELHKYKNTTPNAFMRSALEGLFTKATSRSLLPRGLIVQPVPGDGHCLYHAIRRHLPGNPSVQTLRNQVADYVRVNHTNYSAFITGSLNRYLAGIRHNAWGDHVEIDALMHLYQRPIHVFHDSGEPILQPANSGEFQGAPIPVLFDGINHYNALSLNTALPFNMQQAIQTTPQCLIPGLPAEILRNVSTFLSTPDLAFFFGGMQRAKTLAKNMETATPSFFSTPIQLIKLDTEPSTENEPEASDELEHQDKRQRFS